MIAKEKKKELLQATSESPLVILGGMAGCGKTTLVRTALEYPYVSLRDLHAKQLATSDPALFLATHQRVGQPLIIDDLHLVPNLLKSLGPQVEKGERFILVTSRRLEMGALPHREIILHPPSGKDPSLNLEDSIWNSGLATFHPGRDPSEVYQEFWNRILDEQLPRYLRLTLPEAFASFVGLCAGAIGRTVNYSQLGDNCGVSHNCCRTWMKALEDYYIVHLLHPHTEGYGRRAVRTPKLYFTDTGCAAYLMGIRSGVDLLTHFSRGALFENYVLAELRKRSGNPRFWFWRDKQGDEIDLLIEEQGEFKPLELKAGRSISASYFDGLATWSALTGSDPAKGTIIYGGEEDHNHPMGRLYSWRSLVKLELSNT